jgi:tetratricopeptide (TPR) repeat protein
LVFGVSAHAWVPSDALPPLERSIYEEGRKREQAGDLRGAELRFQKVYEMEPSWTNVLQDVGRVREAQGDVEGAIRAYQLAPFEADAVESLAFLYLRERAFSEAAALFFQLRNLRPDTPEFLPWEASALLEADPQHAEMVFREYLAKTGANLADPDVQRVALDLVRTLHGSPDGVEQAEQLLDRVVSDLDGLEMSAEADVSARDALLNLRERWTYERRASELLASAGTPLDVEAHEALTRARAAFAAHDLDEASSLLESLLKTNGANAATWAALSAVREAQGRIGEAEQAIEMAETLAPLTAAYPRRLGGLLAMHYGGRRDQEAAEAYRRALRRTGSEPHLWLELSRVEHGDRALASLHRFLELVPSGAAADKARLEVANRQRSSPERLIPPEARARPADLSEDAWFNVHLAYVYVLDARLKGPQDDRYTALIDEALVTILAARASAPHSVRVLNLEAEIRVERGELRDAVVLWERSLAQEPDQARVVLDLANVYAKLGDDLRRDTLIQRALALGEPVALLGEAEAEAGKRRWWRARTLLHRYVEVAPPGATGYDRALALRDDVSTRIRLFYLGILCGIVFVIVLPLAVRAYRRSGVGLQALLDRSPSAYRDVARCCAVIRHEILKHNTTVLVSVAQAIDEDRLEPAKWTAEKLYGERGAIARFFGYVEDLEQLARAQGHTVNLRHRDPIFAPLIAAFDRLSALERDLRGTPGPQVATALRSISTILNQTGYRGLGDFVQRACLLEVDEPFLRRVYNELCGEPAFVERTEVTVEIDMPEEPVVIRIFRTDLEDILTNLLRNSLEITDEINGTRVGIHVATEEDPITGLERVCLRVLDDGPQRISTAMIRGRYMGRGLGLAVDLISRNGGSIRVEDDVNWSKAVVVRLPRAEPGEEGP